MIITIVRPEDIITRSRNKMRQRREMEEREDRNYRVDGIGNLSVPRVWSVTLAHRQNQFLAGASINHFTCHEARFIARVGLQAMPNRSIADRASIWWYNIAKYNIVEYEIHRTIIWTISRSFQTKFNISLRNKRFEKFLRTIKINCQFHCENQNFIFGIKIFNKLWNLS